MDFKTTCNHNSYNNMYFAWIVWNEVLKHSEQTINWKKKQTKKQPAPIFKSILVFLRPMVGVLGSLPLLREVSPMREEI